MRLQLLLSLEAEEQARREARDLHAQLGGARWALSESHGEAELLRRQKQQLQAERSQLLARLERVETLLAERHVSFLPDHASHNATVPMSVEPNRQAPPHPWKRQNLWINPQSGSYNRPDCRPSSRALLGAPQLGGEGSTAAQPASARSQDEHAWPREFDLFVPGPAAVEEYGDKGLIVETQEESGSVEARVTQLTSIVQAMGAQPLEGLGAPEPLSSSGAPGPVVNPAYPESLRAWYPHYDCPQVQRQEVQGRSPQGPHPVLLAVHPQKMVMMIGLHAACVEVTSILRKTALSSPRTSRVRVRVSQTAVRGVVGVVAVPALLGGSRHDAGIGSATACREDRSGS